VQSNKEVDRSLLVSIPKFVAWCFFLVNSVQRP